LGSEVLFYVLHFGIDGGMHFLLMVETLALSCLTSCFVSMKLEYKELKRDSKSCLRVWAMMKMEKGQGVGGTTHKMGYG
jgi:hypothetical protein